MAKSIIITGASSGIGLATANLFLQAGWQVGLLARRKEKLEVAARGHDNAHVLVADVTDAQAMERVFADFVKAVGRLDVLFNNAGMFGPSSTIDQVSIDDWQQVLNVNLSGMFYGARLAFAQMRNQSPQGGRIINNGSISAYSPRVGSVCYTTTKHAISGLTKTLSVDGRPFDISCGQIDIGNARTEMVENLISRTLAAEPDAEVMPSMDVSAAADSVFHMAGLPPEANVLFMTVMASKMEFVGRG